MMQEHLRLLFDGMSNGVAHCRVMDAPEPGDLVFLEVNDAFERVTGLQVTEGQRASEVAPDFCHRHADFLQHLREVASTGLPQRFETHGYGPHETYSLSVAALSHEPGHVVAIFDSNTERHAAEALRESEERMRSIVASMAEGVVFQSANGAILTCNAAAERLLGLSFAQMQGRTSVDPRWRAIRADGSPFPGETHPAMVTLRTGVPQSNVVMGVHKPDGELSWISISAEPLRRKPDDAPYAVVTTFADITALKNATRELRETSARLAFAIDGADVGSWDWDILTGRVQHSPRWASLLGYEPGELEDKFSTWEVRIHPADLARVTASIEEKLTVAVDIALFEHDHQR